MKKFSFSLEKLLELRSHERQQVEHELVKARQERLQYEQELEELAGDLRRLSKQPVPSQAEPSAFRRRAAHRNKLQSARENLRKSVVRLRRQEEKVREVLVKHRRREETLESLREQEKADYKEAHRRRQTKQLDALGLTGHVRDNPLSDL